MESLHCTINARKTTEAAARTFRFVVEYFFVEKNKYYIIIAS
jgi:hypothetical protein